MQDMHKLSNDFSLKIWWGIEDTQNFREIFHLTSYINFALFKLVWLGVIESNKKST